MSRRIVPEFDDARVPLERRLYDAALHAPPASVNQPHLTQTGFRRGVDVLGDDAAMSRGAKAWRSNSPSIGMRIGPNISNDAIGRTR